MKNLGSLESTEKMRVEALGRATLVHLLGSKLTNASNLAECSGQRTISNQVKRFVWSTPWLARQFIWLFTYVKRNLIPS